MMVFAVMCLKLARANTCYVFYVVYRLPVVSWLAGMWHMT